MPDSLRPDNDALIPVLPATADALLRRVAREQAGGRAPALVAGVVRDGELAWHAGRGRVAALLADVPENGRADGRPDNQTAAQPAGASDGLITGQGKAPGRRESEGRLRPDADVQFRIGSITKTFTAVLLARLRDEGRLSFEDRLDRHLPGTPLDDRTIEQLLSHTSGVQAETDGPWWERSPGTSWDDLQKTFGAGMLRHPAGRRFHYSNLGYAALGELVARLRGRPWYDVLRSEVLDPLGMSRTTYLQQAPHAQGYAVHPWADVILPEPAHDAGAMAPAGQLWSTVGDLARWAAFLGGSGDPAILGGETLEEMREPRTAANQPGWSSSHGLGLQILEAGGRRLVGHGGSMPGFLAGLFVDVDEGLGAVAMANTTTGVAPGTLAASLVEIVSDREPRVPSEWTPATRLPDGLLDLVGVWYWGPSAFALRARGSKGELELGPAEGRGRASRFRPSGTDTWSGHDGYYAGERLRAVRRPDGTVSHFDLASFVFTREPYDSGAPVPGGVDPAGWR